MLFIQRASDSRRVHSTVCQHQTDENSHATGAQRNRNSRPFLFHRLHRLSLLDAYHPFESHGARQCLHSGRSLRLAGRFHLASQLGHQSSFSKSPFPPHRAPDFSSILYNVLFFPLGEVYVHHTYISCGRSWFLSPIYCFTTGLDQRCYQQYRSNKFGPWRPVQHQFPQQWQSIIHTSQSRSRCEKILILRAEIYFQSKFYFIFK